MLKRNLTKIEPKLEDLLELENNKNQVNGEASSAAEKTDQSAEPLDLVKTKEMVEARIGYNPRPRRAN